MVRSNAAARAALFLAAAAAAFDAATAEPALCNEPPLACAAYYSYPTYFCTEAMEELHGIRTKCPILCGLCDPITTTITGTATTTTVTTTVTLATCDKELDGSECEHEYWLANHPMMCSFSDDDDCARCSMHCGPQQCCVRLEVYRSQFCTPDHGQETRTKCPILCGVCAPITTTATDTATTTTATETDTSTTTATGTSTTTATETDTSTTTATMTSTTTATETDTSTTTATGTSTTTATETDTSTTTATTSTVPVADICARLTKGEKCKKDSRCNWKSSKASTSSCDGKKSKSDEYCAKITNKVACKAETNKRCKWRRVKTSSCIAAIN